jgi:hypothetical protein
MLREREATGTGSIVDVGTVFLTARECPFGCTFCDLWTHTLADRPPVGAIVSQVEQALQEFADAPWLKLYNSGNFFDPQSIPRVDRHRLLELCGHAERLVVENHPRLCGHEVREYAAAFTGRLEVAMGLESIQPGLLAAFQKAMTIADYQRAVERLMDWQIDVRTFVMIDPPGTETGRAIEWAIASAEFAARHGSRCIALIPARASSVDSSHPRQHLAATACPMDIRTLEHCAAALPLGRVGGPVFTIDLWDFDRLTGCPECRERRRARLQTINLHQVLPPEICCDAACNEALESP